MSRRDAAAVALATLVLHAVIAFAVPSPGQLGKYPLAAAQLLDGELPGERWVDFSPLYLALHVAARHLALDEMAILGLQLALAALAVAGVYLLLQPRVGRGVALATVAVLALDRHLLVYGRLFEPEVVLLFLVVGFLVAVERGRPVVAGSAGALALLVRPTFLPLFLLVPVVWLIAQPARWRRVVAVAAPVALAMAFLGAIGDRAGGDWKTPTMNPGTVFFEGNHPLSRGTSAVYPPIVYALLLESRDAPDAPHVHYRRVARASAQGELSVSDVNAFWSRRASAFLADEPEQGLRRVLGKLLYAGHRFRWHDVPAAWKLDSRLPLPTLPFSILGVLAAIGAVAAARHWRRDWMLYAAGLLPLAVMVAFYVSARQRLAMLPATFVFAAIGALCLARRGRRAWPVWIAAATAAVVLSLPDDAIRDARYRHADAVGAEHRLDEVRELTARQPLAHHADLAVAAISGVPWAVNELRPAFFPRHRGSFDERLADFLATRPASEATAAAAFDRAAVSLTAGRPVAAEELLTPVADRLVYRGGRGPSQPLLLLARGAADRGDREAAAAYLRRAKDRVPGDAFVLAELVALGDDASAADELLRWWSPLDGQLLVGRALLRNGRAEEAAAALAFVARRLPELVQARMLLAAALARGGRIDEAARLYLDAAAERLEPILAGDAIAELFTAWAAAHPEDPGVLLQAAQVLDQQGRFAAARALLDGVSAPPGLAAAIEAQRRRLDAELAAIGRLPSGVAQQTGDALPGSGERRRQSADDTGERGEQQADGEHRE